MSELAKKETIGGATGAKRNSIVSGMLGDVEGECSRDTFPTFKSPPAGPGIEPNQTSSESVVAKQGNTGSNTSAESTTPSIAIGSTSANNEEKEKLDTN